MLALLLDAVDAEAAVAAGEEGAALPVSAPLLDFALSEVALFEVALLEVTLFELALSGAALLLPLLLSLPAVLLPPLPLPLLRKSVTYQPVPLSAKPAAVTCLAKLSVLQTGQSVSAGSLILRKVSCV